MVNIRQEILEADDQMFVIADGKADTANIAAVQTAQSNMQLAAAADKSNKCGNTGKCPQLKCEDIFYMSGIKKSKRKKKIQCSKCEKSREYLEYLAKELDAFKKAHNLFSNEKVASTKQTAPKRRKGRKARKANKGFSTQIPLRSCCCPPPCGGNTNTHDACTTPNNVNVVPKNMGWNWTHQSVDRKGWRPGAIPRAIRDLMCHFLVQDSADLRAPTLPTPGRVPATPARPQRPMIQVQRRNDEYAITMTPLKGGQQLRTTADPYQNCEPITVRITANRSREDERIAQIKQVIHERGFRRCRCGLPVSQCQCRDRDELAALRKCVQQCGSRFGIVDLGEKLSINQPPKDLELDFTPPAAVVKAGFLESQQPQDAQSTQYLATDVPPDEVSPNQQATDGGAKKAKKGKGGKKK